MVQSDDVASYVFPSPVMCCQLTKMGILVRNVVTGIVLRMVEPGVGEGGLLPGWGRSIYVAGGLLPGVHRLIF